MGFYFAMEMKDLMNPKIIKKSHESMIRRSKDMDHPTHAVSDASSYKDISNLLFIAQVFTKAIIIYEKGPAISMR